MNPDTAQPEEQLHRDWLYQLNPGYYDETVAPEGTMRTHWQPLMEPLEQMGHAGFARRWQEGRRVNTFPRSGRHRRQTGVVTALQARSGEARRRHAERSRACGTCKVNG